jgi:NitT/TauT family transport system ATP-binding protein
MPGVGAPRPLEIEISRKIYRGADKRTLEVVRDFELAVAPHSFVALIGPSGCGKTTILRIVLGLDRDFEGRIRPEATELAAAMVFQEPRLLPWRTVEDNVRLALRASGRHGAPLGALFTDLGLADWRDRYPGELSLGMARRAALARALAVEPDLLLLDEPFVSLDERAAGELRALVCRVTARRRASVILVTHNLREALELADRLIFLSARPARIVADIALARARDLRTDDWLETQRRDLVGRLATLVE